VPCGEAATRHATLQVGVPVAEVIRKTGISEQTFYRWKAKYAGLEVDEVRRMAQLQEENMRLKQLVAELTLDKAMLQDVLSKKWWSLHGVDRWWRHWWVVWRSRTASVSSSACSKGDLPLPQLPRSTN
jgi:putative transposase